MKEKMYRMTISVPGVVYDELAGVAKECEWSIPHLVRFILLCIVDAWIREDLESVDDGPKDE